MILSPNLIQYTNAINWSIQAFTGYQIVLSFTLPQTISFYDRIQKINELLNNIHSSYRKINRRANIDSFLVTISNRNSSETICTVLVRHDHQLHVSTVQDRILMIRGLVSGIDNYVNVFKPYKGIELDIQKYHLRGCVGNYSINTIKSGQNIQFLDCVEV